MTTYKYFNVEIEHAHFAYIGGGEHIVYAPVLIDAACPDDPNYMRLVWASWGGNMFAIYDSKPSELAELMPDALYSKCLGDIDLPEDLDCITDDYVDMDKFDFKSAFDGWGEVAQIMYRLFDLMLHSADRLNPYGLVAGIEL